MKNPARLAYIMTIANEGIPSYEPPEPNKSLEPIEWQGLSAADNIDYEPETALEEELESDEGEALEEELDEGISLDEKEFFHIFSAGSTDIKNAVKQEKEKEASKQDFKKTFKTTRKAQHKAIPQLLFITKILASYYQKEWLNQGHSNKMTPRVITKKLPKKSSNSVVLVSQRLQDIFLLQKNKLKMLANLTVRYTQMIWKTFLEESSTTEGPLDVKKWQVPEKKKRIITLLSRAEDKNELYERLIWLYQYRHINTKRASLRPDLDIDLFPGEYQRKWSALVKKKIE
ncbi:hypothetical protein CLAVI_000345 [Candidatus Clavichlamydia salmonicola]|uniref:hypothetical protein n=1 Tax=Candidatus Clavichlamydia salmonicola TaxID=469812 RepID=UPI001891D594|nr:hypothetical protein [Candidatus Clavichlamydia salmonicola]MBF5050727.1 hypothetical protein [Candidatus Clavichlamydia salmonicola]